MHFVCPGSLWIVSRGYFSLSRGNCFTTIVGGIAQRVGSPLWPTMLSVAVNTVRILGLQQA